MPRDNKTRICTQAEVICYEAAIDELSKRGVNKCNCLPSCTSVAYDAEISQAHFEFVKALSAFGEDLNELPGAIMARLTIFFKEEQFITSRRSELYGWPNFIANCGGLLGEI
jgi:acid-sensing ion channel, other